MWQETPAPTFAGSPGACLSPVLDLCVQARPRLWFSTAAVAGARGGATSSLCGWTTAVGYTSTIERERSVYSSYGQPAVIMELTTGQRLNVTGQLSGRRKIVALAIVAEPLPKVEPIVRKRVAAAATVTLPGGVLATSGGLPLVYNPRKRTKIKILVIPIWAADSNGDACPGTTLPTYTLPLGARQERCVPPLNEAAAPGVNCPLGARGRRHRRRCHDRPPQLPRWRRPDAGRLCGRPGAA
jgi:hypothetical protein